MIAPSARDDIAGHPYTRQKPRKLRFLMTDNNNERDRISRLISGTLRPEQLQ
jgi:hypothetical protein